MDPVLRGVYTRYQRDSGPEVDTLAEGRVPFECQIFHRLIAPEPQGLGRPHNSHARLVAQADIGSRGPTPRREVAPRRAERQGKSRARRHRGQPREELGVAPPPLRQRQRLAPHRRAEHHGASEISREVDRVPGV